MRVQYRYKRRPYDHQRKALRFLISNKWGGALLMEPRTGKTKVVIDYASVLHQAGKVSRVLIFAPVNALGVWADEIEANCPYKYTITVWDKKARKRKELPRVGRNTIDFVICNYDALSTPPKITGRDEYGQVIRSRNRGGRFEIRKKLKLWQPDLVVLDESHRIKTPSARKSYACHQFHDIAPYRVICTGTVVTKKKRLFDIYSQWKFLNQRRFVHPRDCETNEKHKRGDLLTFEEFKGTFARFREARTSTGQKYAKFVANRNEDLLHAEIHKDAYSVRRDECFDLPARTSQRIICPLDESAEAYDQMYEDMVARIATGEVTEASIKLVQGMRLRQISSGLAKTMPSSEYPKGRLVVIGAEKLRMLESRLEDLFEAEEKVIIGASFRGDIARIHKLLGRMRVPHYTIMGGVKPKDRDYARKQFQLVSSPAVFIGHPAAASEAIDLSSASIMIWYSLPTSWVQFEQFRDRNALSGRPTFEEWLCSSPMDQMLWDTLMEDGDLGKKMITSPERLAREGA